MKVFLLLVCIAIAGFAGFVISERKHKQADQRIAVESSGSADLQQGGGNLLGMPWDYFPVNPNKRWVYNITVHSKNINPLNHRVTLWPISDKEVSMVETRGILLTGPGTDGKTQLVLKVVGPASRQGSLSYPEGYEIAVERDDLRIYEGTEKVFWAVSRSRNYSVEEVRVLKPDGIGSPSRYSPWGSLDSRPGEEQRFMFFGEKPGMRVGIVDRNDDLLFVGSETFNGHPALHFQRIIKKNDPEGRSASHLDAGYEEDMWFKKGIGLAKLEQRVNGTLTMTWILEERVSF